MSSYRFYRNALRLLLAMVGGLLASAAIPMCFPVSWMETIHAQLQLGAFPRHPLTIYLARSTSALYAIHGCVLLYTAWYFDRLRLLVPLLGWVHVVFGLVVLGIDLTAPMPLYWTAMEGIPVSLAGALILWLRRKAEVGEQSDRIAGREISERRGN